MTIAFDRTRIPLRRERCRYAYSKCGITIIKMVIIQVLACNMSQLLLTAITTFDDKTSNVFDKFDVLPSHVFS